jgi:hypothetical protein
MFTTPARNSMLDGLLTGSYYATLHTAYPTLIGAATGELPAGKYARKIVSFGAATGGVRTSSGPVIFDVPASTTVNWIGFATSATVGAANIVAASPNGANPKEYTLDNVANTLYSPGHGILASDLFATVYGGTPPTGLTEGTTYSVVVATLTADTIQLALTATPTVPIVLTGQPGVGALLARIVPESFGSIGTFTLAAGATLNLNY